MIDAMKGFSYIVDKDGNNTHAVVPIEAWLVINDLVEACSESIPKNIEIPIIVDTNYRRSQLLKLLPLVESMDYDSVEDWQKKYQEFFKYMDGLKYTEVEMLYRIRDNFFIEFLDKYKDEEARNSFSHYYSIVSRDGTFSLEEAKELRRSVVLSDEEFIKFFKKKYIHDVEDKKIRIEAERNRLFIFDLMELYPEQMELDYDITRKEAQSKLMKFIFNGSKGAKTQVQRALKQASVRTSF
jgi:hypothetical protein